jgi:putative membrane protein insertion efficiency factor
MSAPNPAQTPAQAQAPAPARAVAAGLTFYKRRVSPLLPRSCRFSPTCSEYARLAILKHGVIVGSAKAFWRLMRCQPMAAGGIDLP